jgi:divalent metal cation (Fe/Co/Zn/Cd) transporter
LVKFYPLADSFFAAMVALYIFYETYHLGRETINLLLDTANPNLEIKLKRYLNGRHLQYSELKTRKTGSTNIAELTLHFPPELIAASVTKQIEAVERDLVEQISDLKEVSIGVKPIEFSEDLIRPKFGKRYRYRKSYKT